MIEKTWQNYVFYQIYPASFADSNNDGVGDIKGIISKLDYLKALGVNVIWLSPIYKSPMIDNGYDISDYYQINPQFGDMDSFDELLHEIHKKGMKLIMDLVINHTSDQHPWFKAAIKDPRSKYRKYYIFKKGTEVQPPNNWRSNFGYGSAWTRVNNTNEYYLHVFSSQQPDLNWENPELRSEIYKMINWWLDKGLDGFRLDAITFIKKDQDFASLVADDEDGLVKVKKKSENRPGIEKFLREMHRTCFANRNIVTVGETSGIKDSDFPIYMGSDGVFSMAFDFRYADIDIKSGSEWYRRVAWNPKDLKKLIDESQRTVEKVPGGWAANFLENHDQPRSVSKYIKSKKYRINGIGAKALAMMYFFLRGCPFIYQGQELGCINANRNDINEFNDVSSASNYYQMLKLGISEKDALKYVNQRSRDNARIPFIWEASINKGFNRGHKPWLKLNENHDIKDASEQLKEPHSVLKFYQKLIRMRCRPENKELIFGDYIPLNDLPTSIVGYQRGKKFKILVNLTEKNTEISINRKKVILNSYEDDFDDKDKLRPYEAVLIREEEK